MMKLDYHVFKGMQRDLSISKQNPEFLYDAHNIRITDRGEGTALSITNEKGTSEINLVDHEGNALTLDITKVLGVCSINKYIVIFGKNDTGDYIYKIDLSNNVVDLLYSGPLDIQEDMECFPDYENDSIIKVYWADSKNPPRMINIMQPSSYYEGRLTPFDFVPSLSLQEEISVKKYYDKGGYFPSGVIQYAFTYYNQYGQETNIFYSTPLHTISFLKRGASPEEAVSNSFEITINKVDKGFDYIRVYSILKTSNEATPIVKRVSDVSIDRSYNGDLSVTVFDTGNTGDIVDTTKLLYVGGEQIIARTLTPKDMTLFLGNLKINRESLNEHEAFFREQNISFSNSETVELSEVINTPYYKYYNNIDIPPFYKAGEHYRFGIQFQHTSGKWSEPLWVKDVIISDGGSINNVRPYIGNNNTLSYCAGKLTINRSSIQPGETDVIEEIKEKGYRKARGVVVLPTIQDRLVLTQGILCPTVFNVRDRKNNVTYAMSSWFFRPNSPKKEDELEIYERTDEGSHVISDVYQYGVYPIYRHFGNLRGSDLQTIANKDGVDKEALSWDAEIEGWDSRKAEYINDAENHIEYIINTQPSLTHEAVWNDALYMIDRSIVTLHSPEVEFDDNIQDSYSNFKLRLIGKAKIQGAASDIDIQTSTPPSDASGGLKKKTFVSQGIHAGRNLISYPVWYDGVYTNNTGTISTNVEKLYYMIYPWNKSLSLNNDVQRTSGTRTSLLLKKKISNLKFCDKFIPFLQTSYDYEISRVQLFDSDDVQLIKLGDTDFFYKGNVDTIIDSTTRKIWATDDGVDDVVRYIDEHVQSDVPNAMRIHSGPIRMKYKSSRHLVFYLKDSIENMLEILPYHSSGMTIKVLNPTWDALEDAFKREEEITVGVHHYSSNIPYKEGGLATLLGEDDGSYFLMSELYREESDVQNAFGGDTADALKANQWLIAGEPVDITGNGNITITYKYGDTYYQRYDCLKTYPFTQEDENSIVDIASFMCETRVNIDGRYDKNRASASNLYMQPTNFNLLNPVYTQKNNYFTYRKLDESYYKNNSFPTQITWTTEKQPVSDTDAWTNITLANTLNLDGRKGSVTSLNVFKDNILCFQELGLSQILFNSRVQIPTNDGVPIELSNSYKVDGQRYLSDSIGCINNKSITSTPKGIYFQGNPDESLYLFSGELVNLSDTYSMTSWFRNKNIRSFYDNYFNDVYFVDNNESLCFSEKLNSFTSFYSYNKIAGMNVYNKGLYSVRDDGSLYKHFVGDYNNIYGKDVPFDLSFVSNRDVTQDKIFTNLELRTDFWKEDTLTDGFFSTIQVDNEYQDTGENLLTRTLCTPSNTKKKFRVWRIQIPRDQTNKFDRIRNTWARVKLQWKPSETNVDNNVRMVLHDLNVNYII